MLVGLRQGLAGPVIANGAPELADDGMLDAMVVDDHVSGAGGRRRFTADEYQRMGELGILSDDERVELIEGEILTMSPIYPTHAAAVDRANRVMNMTAAAQAIVRVQNPIRLNLFSEPQPDIVLLHPRDDFYASAHPGPEDVLLAIEIADSSLRYDRDVKAPLYARAGIVEYWLVDLSGQSVTGYTDVSGGVYSRSVTWRRGQSLAPEQLPGVILRVDDLLA